jgi:amino acid adenylation domain-containing protein
MSPRPASGRGRLDGASPESPLGRRTRRRIVYDGNRPAASGAVETKATMALSRYLSESARRHPGRVAVEEESGGGIRYRDLEALSDRVRDRLVRRGVRPGDRVALCLPKTIDGVALIFGILKARAAYVPLDPTGPPSRAAMILSDCGVSAVFVAESLRAGLAAELSGLAAAPPLVALDAPGGGRALAAWLEREGARDPAPQAPGRQPEPDERAYILYTSGSTGRPKGVVLSHRNAESFVEWCAETFAPRESDRFSSHAPFHFDLSILDLYLPLRQAATLVLIGEKTAKEPQALAALLERARLSVWYSTPSILRLLTQYGKLRERDCSSLRLVLFAGEVFPTAQLRLAMEQLPGAAWFNLYGPTETNVCTWHPIPAVIPPERTEPFPIGRVCRQLEARVVDPDGRPVAPGAEGELLIRGPNVMQGYWNLPEQTARAFLGDDPRERWYRTGDLVVEEAGGVLRYLGRRDRMVKKRGYRVELGEIEACLHHHPQVFEAAVVAVPDASGELRVVGNVATAGGERLSLIALKRFCAERLPVYMVPDAFRFHERLPKTSTDKIDYQTLAKLALEAPELGSRVGRG